MQLPPYRHPAWRRIRKAVLIRDGYQCQVRRAGCKTLATQADHIVDWQDGGPPLDPRNLQASCKPCNVGKRNAHLADLARKQRQQSRPW